MATAPLGRLPGRLASATASGRKGRLISRAAAESAERVAPRHSCRRVVLCVSVPTPAGSCPLGSRSRAYYPRTTSGCRTSRRQSTCCSRRSSARCRGAGICRRSNPRWHRTSCRNRRNCRGRCTGWCRRHRTRAMEGSIRARSARDRRTIHCSRTCRLSRRVDNCRSVSRRS